MIHYNKIFHFLSFPRSLIFNPNKGQYVKKDGTVGFCGSAELKGTQSLDSFSWQAVRFLKHIGYNNKLLLAKGVPERTGTCFGEIDEGQQC